MDSTDDSQDERPLANKPGFRPFKSLAQVANAIARTAGSAIALVEDADLRKRASDLVLDSANKGFTTVRQGVVSGADNLQQRIRSGPVQVQAVLGSLQKRIEEQRLLVALKEERDAPVDVQIGPQLYEKAPQELRSRLWMTMLDNPSLANDVTHSALSRTGTESDQDLSCVSGRRGASQSGESQPEASDSGRPEALPHEAADTANGQSADGSGAATPAPSASDQAVTDGDASADAQLDNGAVETDRSPAATPADDTAAATEDTAAATDDISESPHEWPAASPAEAATPPVPAARPANSFMPAAAAPDGQPRKLGSWAKRKPAAAQVQATNDRIAEARAAAESADQLAYDVAAADAEAMPLDIEGDGTALDSSRPGSAGGVPAAPEPALTTQEQARAALRAAGIERARQLATDREAALAAAAATAALAREHSGEMAVPGGAGEQGHLTSSAASTRGVNLLRRDSRGHLLPPDSQRGSSGSGQGNNLRAISPTSSPSASAASEPSPLGPRPPSFGANARQLSGRPSSAGENLEAWEMVQDNSNIFGFESSSGLAARLHPRDPSQLGPDDIAVWQSQAFRLFAERLMPGIVATFSRFHA